MPSFSATVRYGSNDVNASTEPAASAAVRWTGAPAFTLPAASGAGEYRLVVTPSPNFYDGRGANKPWLQELPDPVNKIAWQTVIELHPETAKKLNIEEGDHATVTTASGSVTAPVYLYIGLRPDTIAVQAGRGHTAYGRYANGCGVNAMSLLPSVEGGASGAVVLSGSKASVAKASGSSRLVTTEGSGRQHGRGIARALTVADLMAGKINEEKESFVGQAKVGFLPGLRSPVANDAQGELGDPKSKDKGQYDPNHWSGVAKRRWAMTIDLARCTGCSACVTACYSENNIPTVGASHQGAQVMPDRTGFGANITRSREMAWIRLERYFEIDREPKDVAWNPDFETRVVPMMCQHCGNAPCEPVCPVYATYHSPDGLNVQVYNRCVGTRYCANNCPYKVRRFNFLLYTDWDTETLKMQRNPDVTVRSRGVMEKCTYCVQRINIARIDAKRENRLIADGEVVPACQQACPSDAIAFGNLNDKESQVVKRRESGRNYALVGDIGTRPRTTYLIKLKNPSNQLAKNEKTA